jgi:peptidoglycan/LPS O-acetylase OafA/YrhL
MTTRESGGAPRLAQRSSEPAPTPEPTRTSSPPPSPPEQKRSRVLAVDGMRAVACMMVLTYHTSQTSHLSSSTAGMVSQFSRGVDIFMVLSGFCLFLPFVTRADRYSTKRFYGQRARRIFPAYYASLVYVVALPVLLVVVYKILKMPAHWQPFPGVGQWVTHLTFTQNFFTSTWSGMNGSLWTMSLEMQFYLLMPLLVFLYRRYGVRSLIVPFAVSAVWNTVLALLWQDKGFNAAHFLWQATAFGRWAEFAAGMAAAIIVTRVGPTLSTRTADAIAAGGIVGVVLLLAFGDSLVVNDFSVFGYALAVGAILVGVSCGQGLVARSLQLRPIAYIGLISYSFYLLHQPTEWYFSQFMQRHGLNGITLWVAQMTVGLAAVILIASISFRYLERPFLGSVQRRQPARAEVVQAPSTGLRERLRTRFGSGQAGSLVPALSRLSPPSRAREGNRSD